MTGLGMVAPPGAPARGSRIWTTQRSCGICACSRSWELIRQLAHAAIKARPEAEPGPIPLYERCRQAEGVLALPAGLFDPARLALLPDALADFRSLGDPNGSDPCTACPDQLQHARQHPHHCQWGLPPCLARWSPLHHIVVLLRADGQHVPSPASCLMLAQSACSHTAAGTRTCGLPPFCAQSAGLRPCPLTPTGAAAGWCSKPCRPSRR